MTETIAYIKHSLEGLYPPGEIRVFTQRIMANVCGLQHHQILMSKGKDLSVTEKAAVRSMVERLKEGEPIQYITGEAPFYGLSFRVNPSVLIPRPETEELVERIVKDCAGRAPLILDIGTGSGCIAVSLAHSLPDSQVTALDISAEALSVARENARLKGVEVAFVETDILSRRQARQAVAGAFDLIVSNPPYVRMSEQTAMEKNVLNYEPPLALFVADADPLLFYRAIARFAEMKLRPWGELYLEINAQLGKETVELLREEGFGAVELIRDLQGRDRIIKAHR
jgi:release factor glutamine methyltransferase